MNLTLGLGAHVPPSVDPPPSKAHHVSHCYDILPCAHYRAHIMDRQFGSLTICTFLPISRVSLPDFFSQAWSAYQALFNRGALKRQRELKSDLLSKKAELLQTSAQDQFAKWARLRRSVDKGLADLEKLSCVYATLHVPQLMTRTQILSSARQSHCSHSTSILPCG